MESYNIALFLYGNVDGIYFIVTLVLGLMLTFNLLKIKKGKVPPFMRMIGLSMLSDTASIAIGSYLYFVTGWHECILISRLLDVDATFIFSLSGFTLLTDRYPSPFILLTLGLPFVVLSTVCCFLPHSWGPALYAFNCYLVVITIVQGVMLFRHDARLKDYYSNIKNRRTTWFVYYVLLLMVSQTFYYEAYYRLLWGNKGIMLFFIFMIFFYIFIAHRVFIQERNKSMHEKEEETVSVVTPDVEDSKQLPQMGTLATRMNRIMMEKRLYLNADLTTAQLAKAIGMSNGALSSTLRNDMKMHFYEYVNSFRIRDAKVKLQNTDDKIETIALSCGFNSYNSFVSVFKKYEGESPSQWKASHTS